MTKLKTISNSKGLYVFSDGSTLKREKNTLTPNGMKMNGRWVYRDKSEKILGFDQYCNDLADQFSLDLYNLVV